MDNCFRRFAEVEISENWSIPNKSWNEIGSTDMLASGEGFTPQESAKGNDRLRRESGANLGAGGASLQDLREHESAERQELF